jgi:23S rRNA (cytosine1962-C5)-methyltransferase
LAKIQTTKIQLHPQTVKSLNKGHPWVTKDAFSDRFPKDKFIINLYDPDSGKYLGQFLNDPNHPQIKARFWSSKKLAFFEVLQNKLEVAIKKRDSLASKRDNFYLCFGEADGLPGLFIQKLGSTLLIQYTAFCWEREIRFVCRQFEESYLNIWTQKRLPGEKKSAPEKFKGEETSLVIQENEIKFKLYFDRGHDIGIYTDMASIRENLLDYFQKSKNLLNLFSYTGAFSLMGLKAGMQVTSVDVSSSYMKWLEENIELNQFDPGLHTSMVTPCEKALKKFEGNEKFDLIICDPPSFSSDGKKSESAINFYKKNLPSMTKCLSENGYLIIFLNTHSISREKFRSTVREVIPSSKIIKELGPSGDCPSLQNFPEGDYLKGIIIK